MNKLFPILLVFILFIPHIYAEPLTFKLAIDAHVRPNPCVMSTKYVLEKDSVLEIVSKARAEHGKLSTIWYKVETEYGDGWISDQNSTTPSEVKLMSKLIAGCKWTEFK